MSVWGVHTTSHISCTATIGYPLQPYMMTEQGCWQQGISQRTNIFAMVPCDLYLYPTRETEAAVSHRMVAYICWSTHHHKKRKKLKLHAPDNLSCSKVSTFIPYFPLFLSWLFKKMCEISSYCEHFSITARKLEIMRRFRMKWNFTVCIFLYALLLKIVIKMVVTIPFTTYEKCGGT
jgi:hypothetical protein